MQAQYNLYIYFSSKRLDSLITHQIASHGNWSVEMEYSKWGGEIQTTKTCLMVST